MKVSLHPALSALTKLYQGSGASETARAELPLPSCRQAEVLLAGSLVAAASKRSENGAFWGPGMPDTCWY